MNSSLKTASLLALSVATALLGIGCLAEAHDPSDEGEVGAAEEAAIVVEEQFGIAHEELVYGDALHGGIAPYGLGYGGYEAYSAHRAYSAYSAYSSYSSYAESSSYSAYGTGCGYGYGC
jgi:hypothetical protein